MTNAPLPSWLASLLRGGLALTMGASALAGCADAPGEDGGPVLDEKIIDGQFTLARPEIGRMQSATGACTATLVRPNVLITAAHCVQYQNLQNHNGQFRIDLPTGGARTYTWDTARVFSQDLGAADLALLRLASPVEASVATPTTIATTDPPAGSALRLFGYGCSDRANNHDDHQGRKQTANLVAGQTSSKLCPGDSGGPVTVGDDGPVYLINSGYYVQSGADIFGRPVQYRAQLEAVIAEWAGGADPGLPPSGQQPPSGGEDICEQQGWYGDGVCDQDCARPDPDCGNGQQPPQQQPPQQQPPQEQPPQQGDYCAQQGWYGDGVCDQGCPMPDPDCGNGQQPPQEQPPQQPPQQGGDICEQEGWYGDGICDQDCARPDPDCGGGQQPPQGQAGDICEQQGWYGDGWCDLDCARPDPDCNGGGGQQGGDWCTAWGYYGDGICDYDCPMPDPDCG